MFTFLVCLLFAVLGLTLFFGIAALLIAIKFGDQLRVERLLDLYIDVFAAGASAIIGALKIFRRRDVPPEIPPSTKTLPPPEKESADNIRSSHLVDCGDAKLIASPLHSQRVPSRQEQKEDQDA